MMDILWIPRSFSNKGKYYNINYQTEAYLHGFLIFTEALMMFRLLMCPLPLQKIVL